MLAGDELKQDQFKFIYRVMKIVYDSALRDFMLGEDPRVMETVIPKLVAYHSLLNIKRIFDIKYDEKKKELEKMEREGKKVKFEGEEEKKAMTTEEVIMRKRIEDKLNTS